MLGRWYLEPKPMLQTMASAQHWLDAGGFEKETWGKEPFSAFKELVTFSGDKSHTWVRGRLVISMWYRRSCAGEEDSVRSGVGFQGRAWAHPACSRTTGEGAWESFPSFESRGQPWNMKKWNVSKLVFSSPLDFRRLFQGKFLTRSWEKGVLPTVLTSVWP